MGATFEGEAMGDHARVVVVDREQREAIREEISVHAHNYGGIDAAFDARDRQDVIRHLERFEAMVALMDAIGWREHPEAPDEQPVHVDERGAQILEAQARESAADLDAGCNTDHPAWLDRNMMLLATLRQLVVDGEKAA
jgi:hypothetical protein